MYGHVRWSALGFEPVITLLEIDPEVVPRVIGVSGEPGGGHAEGEDVYPEEGLAVLEGEMAEGVDLLDEGVRHGKAAD